MAQFGQSWSEMDTIAESGLSVDCDPELTVDNHSTFPMLAEMLDTTQFCCLSLAQKHRMRRASDVQRRATCIPTCRKLLTSAANGPFSSQFCCKCPILSSVFVSPTGTCSPHDVHASTNTVKKVVGVCGTVRVGRLTSAPNKPSTDPGKTGSPP